jgi:hypothetical protein
MDPRLIAVLTLVAAHALAILMASHLPDRIAALVAGSIYLPLLPLNALGLPVFGRAVSGGWASPSVLGWGLLGVFWASLWWTVIFGLARVFRYRV